MILLGEEGAARLVPSDSELERTFKTSGCYELKRFFILLTTLESSWRAKGTLDFLSGAFSIGRIMSQNALSSAKWREIPLESRQLSMDAGKHQCGKTGDRSRSAYMSAPNASDVSFSSLLRVSCPDLERVQMRIANSSPAAMSENTSAQPCPLICP